MSLRFRFPAVAGAALLWLLPHPGLAAQVPQPQPTGGVVPQGPGQQPGQQPGQYPVGGFVRPPLEQAPAQAPPWANPFSPPDTGIAPFQGFPTFPPALGGYGGYPQPPRALVTPPEPGAGAAPPPLLPEPPAWPSWLLVRATEPVPFGPDRAVLMRSADRVWFRTPDEEAFVPLYYFDKMRGIPAGTEIEVRRSGEFQILCHDGSRLYSFGPADLKVAALEEARVRLEWRSLTHLRIVCRNRPHEIALPDGSTVRTAAEQDSAGPVDLRLERRDGRVSVFNAGVRAASLVTPFGEQPLEPGSRAFLLLVPPDPAVPAPLSHVGIAAERRGRELLCRGAEGGEVTWCGARFDLPAGTTLLLDPLQGSPFDTPPTGNRP
jgi:hypothetical protein